MIMRIAINMDERKPDMQVLLNHLAKPTQEPQPKGQGLMGRIGKAVFSKYGALVLLGAMIFGGAYDLINNTPIPKPSAKLVEYRQSKNEMEGILKTHYIIDNNNISDTKKAIQRFEDLEVQLNTLLPEINDELTASNTLEDRVGFDLLLLSIGS